MKRLNFEISDDAHIKVRIMAGARQLSQKALIETMINEAYFRLIRENPDLIPSDPQEVKHEGRP